ncbi:MAG: hypothetical protein LC808_01350 [Actinobacteria bacterium]|nr:hypothetical protein [Actinomycetota bacterium]
MRVVVNDRTQISHEGRVYGAGEELDVSGPLASKWKLYGWAREVSDQDASHKRRSARDKK